MEFVELTVSIEDKKVLNAAWSSVLRDISCLSFLPLCFAECISDRTFSLVGLRRSCDSVRMSREVAMLCREALSPSPLRDRLDEAIVEVLDGGACKKYKKEEEVKFMHGLHVNISCCISREE